MNILVLVTLGLLTLTQSSMVPLRKRETTITEYCQNNPRKLSCKLAEEEPERAESLFNENQWAFLVEGPEDVEGVNVALGKAAYQTSTSHEGAASRAVDGNTDGVWDTGSCTHTTYLSEANPTWWVDLGQSYMVDRVVIFNRMDCCQERLNPFNIHIGDSDQVTANPKCGGDHHIDVNQPSITVSCRGMRGRYVGVRLPGSGRMLTLCEVQVFLATSRQKREIPQPNAPACNVRRNFQELVTLPGQTDAEPFSLQVGRSEYQGYTHVECTSATPVINCSGECLTKESKIRFLVIYRDTDGRLRFRPELVEVPAACEFEMVL